MIDEDTLLTLAFSLLAFGTRLVNLHHGPGPIWDESHFGRFASYYVKRQYYFDVHPPLGKMMIAWAGWMAGFDGGFEFDELVYPPNVPYHHMRRLPAVFGALTVPVAYRTARAMGYTRLSASLAAWMVALDNALVGTSRLILLDSILLFFVATTFWYLVTFNALQHASGGHHFSRAWWAALLGTGLSLGAATSVKWVGLAVAALVGLYTLKRLVEHGKRRSNARYHLCVPLGGTNPSPYCGSNRRISFLLCHAFYCAKSGRSWKPHHALSISSTA